MVPTSVSVTSLLACMAALTACGGGSSDDGGGGPLPPPPPASSFSIGGTVSGLAGTGLVLQSHLGENLPVSGSGAFTFQVRVSPGSAYEVSVRTQPTSDPAQLCTVSNGSGVIGSAPVTNVAVSCATRVSRFIYVPNSGSGDVSAFAINPATGALSAIAGSPYLAGATPRMATATRSGTTLYIANEGSASAPPRISAYSIDASTGTLTAIAGSPFDIGPTPLPSALTPLTRPLVTPSGSALYLSLVGAGSLHGASVNATSGSLLNISGMPFNVGLGLGFGTFTASGNFLFLPHDNHNGSTAGGVAAYSVHQSGVLTSIGSFATGGRVPSTAVLNSQGTLLFAPNAASGTVAVFRVEASGALTAAPGSPFNAGADTVPALVSLHPSKNFVYTTNAFVYGTPSVSNLSAFQLDPSTGVLTPIAGSPFTTNGSSATGARIHPTGKFLYTSNRFSNNIQAYAIDQTTGALTQVPGSPFATGLLPSTVEIDASGRYLFVANADSHTVSSYLIDAATGALTLINSVPAGTTPSAIELVGLAPL